MKDKPVKRRKIKRYHIPAKDRDFLISNLALLLKAAMPVGEAMESLEETTSSRALKKALQQIQADIDEGVSFWQALERSGVANEQTIALVRLGEQSGNLVANLAVAAQQEKKQREFKAQLRSALMYPSFVMVLTLVIGTAIAWFLLPQLADTFRQLNLDLPLVSQIMINFGLFLKENGAWAVPAAAAGLSGLTYIIFFMPGTKRIGQRLLLHMPGIGRLIKEVEIARFGYMFGMLLNAGLNVTDALKMLSTATANYRYKRLYRELYEALDSGYGFNAVLKSNKHARKLLPPSVQQMIIAGERSGALPETLTMVGEIYDEKSTVSTKNLEVMLEPAMLLVVWGGVLFTAISVILPIYSMMGGLR